VRVRDRRALTRWPHPVSGSHCIYQLSMTCGPARMFASRHWMTGGPPASALSPPLKLTERTPGLARFRWILGAGRIFFRRPFSHLGLYRRPIKIARPEAPLRHPLRCSSPLPALAVAEPARRHSSAPKSSASANTCVRWVMECGVDAGSHRCKKDAASARSATPRRWTATTMGG
jgi:hypothetical protein